MSSNYYQCDLPKLSITSRNRVSGIPEDRDQYHFDTLTIDKLLLQIDEMKKDQVVLDAFNTIKELIINKYKLLPLKSDELAQDDSSKSQWRKYFVKPLKFLYIVLMMCFIAL